MAEYLDKVYNALKTKVDGYNDDINVFKEKMQDPNYINKVHKVLQSKISGYNDDINVFQKKLSGEINITPKKETKTAAFQEPEMQPSDMEEQVQSPEVTPVKQEVEQETEKETPFFQGIFGKALDAVGKIGKVAKIVNPQIGGGLEKGVEIFDDVARAINAGVVQGKQVAPSGKVMLLGPNASSEDINTLIEASKEAAALKPSDEMIKFATEYQGGGETTFSFLKALAKNPEVAPELLVTSFSMLANPASAGAFGTTVGSSALLGAAFSPEFLGAGAIPAAIGSLPYAMAAANTTLETGATFVELLQEELNGKDFTEENVRAILEDEDKLAKLRAKSFAKGAIVGVFDAITGRVAGSVGAKLGTGANAKRVLAAASASGIEMAGGSLGEAASRAAIGQKMDVAEIGLEGIAEAPMAIPSVLSAALKMPSYKINGQKVSEPEFESFMKNLSDEDLTKLNITIDNDKRGYTKQIQDRILNYQTKKSILEADPTLTEGQANEIVPLQRKLQELEGNNTEIAKKKKAELKQKIDEIQTMEVPMVTEVVEQAPIEEVVAEKPIVTPKEGQPVIESAVIEVGGKIYEGKNHAEAILNAQKDGQDISKVDRQAEGKFRLDNGEIIDRAQAKEMYGQDRSELLIEQDNASMEANKEYEKLKQQYEKEPTKENVQPMPEGVSGVRTEGEERKTSTELRAEEEVKPTPQKIKILGKDVNMYNDYIPSKVEDVETDAMYTFSANSKDGIPTLLQDVAYANKKEVNGVKTENWYASISGDELIKLYPKKEVTEQAITEAEVIPQAETKEQEPPVVEQTTADVGGNKKSFSDNLKSKGFDVKPNGVYEKNGVRFTVENDKVYEVDNGEPSKYFANKTENSAIIENIENISANKGEASKLLDEIIQVADEQGKELQLFVRAAKVGKLGNKQLTDWYKRKGFEQRADGVMVRKPKAAEQSLQSTPQKGSVVGASLRDVELKMRRPEKNEVIFVSADALLQKHAADQPSYDVQKESNRIKGRVEKAKEFIKNYIKDQRAINPKTGERMNTKVSFEPSVVDIDANGKISFEDGRHRVLAAKEMGLTEVPIEVPKERAKAVEQLLGEKPKQALIEEGKKEVTDLKSGKTTIKNPIKIFKGLFGKRNIDGTIRTAHPNVIGTFGSVDEKIAEKYAGEQKEMTTFDIPAGTTLEVIKVQNPKKGMSILRQEETDLVNNSDAQVVKLITVDTSGSYEDQYIIRDKNLLKPSNIAITTKTSTNENERNQRDQRNQEAKNVLEEKGQEPQAETAPISLEEKVSLVSDPAALNKVTEGTHMVTAKGKAPVEVKNTIKWEQAQIVKRLKKLQKLIDCE